jgi:glycosyltransferase involved in cell wall biosynthesis
MMRVAIVSGSRAQPLMGLGRAEARLLDAMRFRPRSVALDARVVGGRAARSHAARIGARWIPARPGTLPRRATRRAELVHLLGLDLPPPRDARFVATVHDLSPLHYDDEGQLPPWVDEIVERSTLFLTPSTFAACELQKHLSVAEERIRVMGGAPVLEARTAEPLSAGELRALGIEPPIILRFGGYTKRKGLDLLLDGWAHVDQGTLVLAGPSWTAGEPLLSRATSGDRVVVLDHVSDELLGRLLRSARTLVTTSRYEGYGLPPLEAMAAGTPVVAVSAPFVREVCGDAAYVVEPDAEALARAIGCVVKGDAVARRLSDAGLAHAKNFSWDLVAERVLSSYASAAMM